MIRLEGMEHVESMHVHDSRVDSQLSDLQSLANILNEIGTVLPVTQFFLLIDAIFKGRRIAKLFFREIPAVQSVFRHSLLFFSKFIYLNLMRIFSIKFK
jgi:hypothetical protein